MSLGSSRCVWCSARTLDLFIIFLKIRETSGDWNPIRWFSTGARVTSICWHPGFSKIFFVSSGNGNLHTIKLGDTPVRKSHFLGTLSLFAASYAGFTLERRHARPPVVRGIHILNRTEPQWFPTCHCFWNFCSPYRPPSIRYAVVCLTPRNAIDLPVQKPIELNRRCCPPRNI
jgi:hypothetical protein